MHNQNLSDTARAILVAAVDRDDNIVLPPERLPLAARRSVVQSMVKAGLIEEIAAVDGQTVWRTSGMGEQLALRATAAGLAAVTPLTAVDAAPQSSGQGGGEHHDEAAAARAAPDARPTMGRSNLRIAAAALVAAWDATPNGLPWLNMHIDALRAAIAKPTRVPNSRTPRPDTKRSVVLGMLRRSEGATVAQVAEATGWARHTVHGCQRRLNSPQNRRSKIPHFRRSGARACVAIFRRSPSSW